MKTVKILAALLLLTSFPSFAETRGEGRRVDRRVDRRQGAASSTNAQARRQEIQAKAQTMPEVQQVKSNAQARHAGRVTNRQTTTTAPTTTTP